MLFDYIASNIFSGLVTVWFRMVSNEVYRLKSPWKHQRQQKRLIPPYCKNLLSYSYVLDMVSKEVHRLQAQHCNRDNSSRYSSILHPISWVNWLAYALKGCLVWCFPEKSIVKILCKPIIICSNCIILNWKMHVFKRRLICYIREMVCREMHF